MRLFKPMLAGKVPDDLSAIDYPVLASCKLDGIRCIIKDGIAFSRKMIRIPNRNFQVLATFLPDFDGEIMSSNPDHDFNDVQSIVMSEDAPIDDLAYYVFDHISDRSYLSRYMYVIQEAGRMGGQVYAVPCQVVDNAEELQDFHNFMVKKGYEGSMVRSVFGPYKEGRSTTKEGYLMKMKDFFDAEGVVTGFEEKMHNANEAETDNVGRTKRSTKKEGMEPAGVLGSLVVKMEDGTEFKIGTGFTDEMRKDFWERREELEGKVVNFTYQELTKYGVPRFPVFQHFRED